ncbi:MAG: tetratricopeptide repeat protein [Deltaproteobacteria bacterium]|nr:tetratricopeptide repeat protein [Deltaproteobacteria bacterium]
MTDRAKIITTCAFLLILVVSVWLGALQVPFVYDDFVHIVDRPGNLGIAQALRGGYQETRPLFNIVVWGIKVLFGNSLYAFHGLSLLLHSISTILVFLLARRLMPETGFSAPLLVAALFGLHPVQSESVCYINSLSGLLSGLFFILTLLIAPPLAVQKGKAGIRFATAFTFLLALLSKESAAIAPLALFLVDFVAMKRQAPGSETAGDLKNFFRLFLAKRWELIAIAVATLIVLFTVFKNPHKGMAGTDVMSIKTFFLTQLVTVPWFVRLWFWPDNLSILHHPTLHYTLFFLPLLGLLGIMTAILLAYRLLGRMPGLFLGLSLFLVTILPTNSLLPLRDFASERFLYIPSLGLAIVLSCIVMHIPEMLPFKLKSAGPVAFILLAGPYAMAAYARVQVWQDPLRLWSEAVVECPGSVRARTNLARQLGKRKMYSQAIAVLNPAIERAPREPGPRLNRGAARLLEGDAKGALEDYEVVAALYPHYKDPWIGITRAYLAMGNYHAARESAKELIKLDPKNKLAKKVLSSNKTESLDNSR